MKVLQQVKKVSVQLIAIVKADYREKLEVELKELRESELWQAGKTVRFIASGKSTGKNRKPAYRQAGKKD